MWAGPGHSAHWHVQGSDLGTGLVGVLGDLADQAADPTCARESQMWGPTLSWLLGVGPMSLLHLIPYLKEHYMDLRSGLGVRVVGAGVPLLLTWIN